MTISNFSEQLASLNYHQPPRILENFIVLEGLDGSGISTQSALLQQHLQRQGRLCTRSTEPSTGPIGRHIRHLLQNQPENQELLAERQKLPQHFAADRAEHIWAENGIFAQTQAGTICISERYLFSSIVYQGQNIPLEEIWQLNCPFPLPQHFIYLDIIAEDTEKRIAQREATQHSKREIFEQVGFLTQVQQSYLALIAHFRVIAPKMQIHRLDAAQSRDNLHQQILQCLQW